MSRLIDADKLLKGIAELKQSPWFNSKYGYADRKEAVEIVEDLCIKEEPTIDAVEVVRCENCKHCMITDYFTSADEKYVTLYHCKLNDNVLKTNDDYCSYGERREE